VKYFLFFLFLVLAHLFFTTSCTRPDINPPVIDTPSLPIDTTSISVPNAWQCEIDGVSYAGVVDTGFLQMTFPFERADSTIVCVGTTADKKHTLHCKFSLNRTKSPATGVDITGSTYFIFSNAVNIYLAGISSLEPTVTYTADTVSGTSLVINFTGHVVDRQHVIHSLKGKFSCRLYTGDNDPSKFYFLTDSVKNAGYFRSAYMSANTLMLEGIDYIAYPFDYFRMGIRTGGVIKPGTYSSTNGDIVIYKTFPASGYGYFYADDSIGNVTVKILSVEGNVVTGSFTGVNKTLDRLEGGTFKCRVANYIPEPDAQHRWQFGAWVDPAFDLYHSYAGNVTKAVKTSANGFNYLTIYGESDNGASNFKIQLSSVTPIAKGLYSLHNTANNQNLVDSIYFKSSIETWDNVVPYLHADAGTRPFGISTYCLIDSISTNYVSGKFYGLLWTKEGSPREIHKGFFSVALH